MLIEQLLDEVRFIHEQYATLRFTQGDDKVHDSDLSQHVYFFEIFEHDADGSLCQILGKIVGLTCDLNSQLKQSYVNYFIALRE